MNQGPLELTGISDEAMQIAAKLEGHSMLPHVPDSGPERVYAIQRAVSMTRITVGHSIRTLVEVITANEAQLGVHSAPSDD